MQGGGTQVSPEPSSVDSIEGKLKKLLENDQTDFSAWTALIAEVEKDTPNDVRRICLVYDSFLSEFPLCYGYWKKYAGYKARFCTFKEVEEVYERAVKAATFSVDIWISYCSFAESVYEDPADVRRLYERGLSFVGKDYLCYLLWDKYIVFEYSQKQWSCLAHIYINTLRFPTKKLHNYYERSKKLVAIWEEMQDNIETPSDPVPDCDTTDTMACGYAEISNVIRDLLDQEDGICKPKSVKKYKSVVERLYQKTSALDRKIGLFETRIRRPYFHVKPLDDSQLENWHQYLDFVEMQGDFDWAVKLYERCLIPCANYSEFWIRYVEFVEAKGGREIANYAIARALTVFLKKVPAFHIFAAMFKEQIGDVVGARASFLQCGMNLTPDFVEDVYREANREKRMGNTDSACMIYEKAIELAKEMKNEEILLALYINFARFILVVSGSIDAAREVFIKGIQQMPCKFILEGLIDFLTTHGGAGQMPKLDSIVVNAITPGSDVSRALSYHDREDISKLFLQFVDLFGNIHEIRRAWERHWRLFPHIMRPPPPPPPPLPPPPPPPPPPSPSPPPPITTTATTTTSYIIATENILMDKNMEERNGGFSASSRDACGDNARDDADMHIINKPSIQNNAATPKIIPLENSTEGRNGLQIASAHDACADSGHNGMDMHVMNDPALVNNAAILDEGNVTCDLQPEEHKNDTEGIEEHVEVAEVGQKQYTAEGDKVYVEAVEENHDAIQTTQATSVYVATENQIQRHANQESNAGLRPPVLDNLSINSPDNKSQQFNPTISHDCIAQEVTFSSDGNILKDSVNSKGVSAKHASNIVHARSGTPSRANLQKDKSLLHPACEQIPSEAQTNPQLQMQVHPEKDLQQASTVDYPHSQNASSGEYSTQVYYDGQAPENSGFRNHGFVQSSQTQQMLLPAQLQYSPAVSSSQMLIDQGYPCQPLAWSNTQNQQANPTQGQYAMVDAAQVYSSGSLTWPGQSVQQQASVYTQPQPSTLPSSQPQIQVYQHSQQGNEQYGYYQGSQGVQPHIWHYYQQQLYYWQQQHNQQLHNLPQQQWQIEHLQQLQQKLSQQRQAQSQQPPSLLQQQQQNQQPNHQEQQQQQLSPQQKHNQLLQQHESQFPQQSEQVDKTQHQHIMYLQQQQQIYLQQLYLQQQQHLQLLEQQQKQQLLQQQQQQQLLQQQQQQQQLLHPQNLQPQQQVSTVEPKALNSNINLQQSIPVQHSSSQYGQQVVTSQGEGGRLLHAEQSVPSYPSSPPHKAPPNH